MCDKTTFMYGITPEKAQRLDGLTQEYAIKILDFSQIDALTISKEMSIEIVNGLLKDFYKEMNS